MKDANCMPCVSLIHYLPESETPSHISPCNTADSNTSIRANSYVDDLAAGPEFANSKEEKNILVRKIKNLIIDLICSSGEELEINLSQYLSNRLHHDYAYLSALFSKDQGITIERFVIKKKIDRIKDFLLSEKLTITRIALDMNYSSIGHLSNQFKKFTGLTPSQFKKNHTLQSRHHPNTTD